VLRRDEDKTVVSRRMKLKEKRSQEDERQANAPKTLF
jgi:hypothetical protein